MGGRFHEEMWNGKWLQPSYRKRVIDEKHNDNVRGDDDHNDNDRTDNQGDGDDVNTSSSTVRKQGVTRRRNADTTTPRRISHQATCHVTNNTCRRGLETKYTALET